MATQPKTFFTTASQGAIPRMEPHYVTRAEFAAGTGTLLKGTAVAWDDDAGTWSVWDPSGSADQAKIDGFVWVEHDLDASGETIGAVMTAGEVHYDDVLEVNVTEYGSAPDFATACKAIEVRYKNLRVVGLTGTPE